MPGPLLFGQEERRSADGGQAAATPSETPAESRPANAAGTAAGTADETAAATVGGSGSSSSSSGGSRNADVLRRLQLPLFSPTREARGGGGSGGGESGGDAAAARDNVEAMVERAMDSAAEAHAAVAAARAQAEPQAQAPPTAMAVEDSASGALCGGEGEGVRGLCRLLPSSFVMVYCFCGLLSRSCATPVVEIRTWLMHFFVCFL